MGYANFYRIDDEKREQIREALQRAISREERKAKIAEGLSEAVSGKVCTKKLMDLPFFKANPLFRHAYYHDQTYFPNKKAITFGQDNYNDNFEIVICDKSISNRINVDIMANALTYKKQVRDLCTELDKLDETIDAYNEYGKKFAEPVSALGHIDCYLDKGVNALHSHMAFIDLGVRK